MHQRHLLIKICRRQCERGRILLQSSLTIPVPRLSAGHRQYPPRIKCQEQHQMTTRRMLQPHYLITVSRAQPVTAHLRKQAIQALQTGKRQVQLTRTHLVFIGHAPSNRTCGNHILPVVCRHFIQRRLGLYCMVHNCPSPRICGPFDCQ